MVNPDNPSLDASKKSDSRPPNDFDRAFALVPAAQTGGREALEQIAVHLNRYCLAVATHLFKIRQDAQKMQSTISPEDVANTALHDITSHISNIDYTRGPHAFGGFVKQCVVRAFNKAYAYTTTEKRGSRNTICSLDKSLHALPDTASVANGSKIPVNIGAVLLDRAQTILCPIELKAFRTFVQNPDSKKVRLAENIGMSDRAFCMALDRAYRKLSEDPYLREQLDIDLDTPTKNGYAR